MSKGGVDMPRIWLKEIRDGKRMSQSLIASKVGIAQGYYCDIENGIKNPSPKIAKAIAKTLRFNWTKFYDNQQ